MSSLKQVSARRALIRTEQRQNPNKSNWKTKLDVLKFTMLVLALCVTSIMRAEANSASDLESYLQDTQAFSADFEQTILDEEGALVQQSSGKVSLSRPYKMRWETTAPFNYLLVTNGETLWRYDADLEQLNKEPFTEEMQQTPAMLLGSGGADIEQNFEVSVNQADVDSAKDSENQAISFTLIPKQESAFSEMIVDFDKQGRLQSMQMRDALGQTTHLMLKNVQLNPVLKPEQFTIDENKYAMDTW